MRPIPKLRTTAAVILETIPATLGFPPPNPGYLQAVADAARASGALLILDEVQTGLGRTGTNWYYQQQDLKPDMLITGKGLGGDHSNRVVPSPCVAAVMTIVVPAPCVALLS